MNGEANKLLVYSDGTFFSQGKKKPGIMRGSFAAYTVPKKSKWNVEENHARLKEEGEPLVHQEFMDVPPKKTEVPTNTLSEVKTFEAALTWARDYVKQHKGILEVEACIDCQSIERQLKEYAVTHNRPMRKVLQRIRRIIDDMNLPVRVRWIPGEWMKNSTVIAH